MNIKDQIQVLIDDAPDDVTRKAVEMTAPLLQEIAGQLPQEQYYVLQSLGQGWVMTTLRGRQNPQVTKTVVYAYPSLAAASVGQTYNPQMMALPHASTHLLFQLISLKQIDSLIFLREKGKGQGIEIQRQVIEQALALQLKQPPPTEIA